MHSKSLRELPALTYETSECQRTGKFSWFIYFRQFQRQILKTQTILFPKSFISTSEKTVLGLKKQAANFYFNFTQRKAVRYSCFDFFSSEKWRYFQLSGLWITYLTYHIRRTATNVYTEIHKMLNFPSIPGTWNICAKIWLTRPITPYGGINPYRDKKAYTSQSDFYGSKMKLIYEFAQVRASNICKCAISEPCWHLLSHLQNFSSCLFICKS